MEHDIPSDVYVLNGLNEYFTLSTEMQQNNKSIWWKDWVFWFITTLIFGISVLHYRTTLSEAMFHDIYRRLYYLPIIIAAFRYQLIGGIGASLAISLMYLPHLLSHWEVSPEQGLNKLLEMLLYNVVGVLTGVLVSRQEQERKRYELTAQKLDQSLQDLQAQSKRLIETEENLRVADRLAVLGELTASLAHEIRNPLGSIRGSARLLADGRLEESEKRELTDILLKETARMDQVVENYLSVARTNNREQHTFQLNEVMQSIRTLLAEKTRKRKITFSMRLPPEPVTLSMDRNHFYQIVLNILLNSIDAMPSGGTITLTATRNDGTFRMTIHDEGVGIAEDQLPKVWDTFYTTKQNGTGLGLPIVKRMVENNHGTIRLESRKDQGTTVIIELPGGLDND